MSNPQTSKTEKNGCDSITCFGNGVGWYAWTDAIGC